MFEELIDRARLRDREALEQLVSNGDALPEVLQALADDQTAGLLTEGVRRLYRADKFPLLVANLHSEHIGVFRACAEALGRSGDERALSPLLSVVGDSDRLETDRAIAAEALGNLGLASASSTLSAALEEGHSELAWSDYPVLLTSAATALAKLGDHSGFEPVLDALRSEQSSTRSLAARALLFVTGPGAVTALAERTQDSSQEVRIATIEALALLGTPAAVEALIPACQDESDDVAVAALTRLGDLLGEEFGADDGEDEARAAWLQHRQAFRPDICHRLGRPIHLPDLFSEWDTRPDRRDDIAAELTVITGIFVADIVREGGISTARILTEAETYVDGALYKWGKRVTVS